MPSYRTSDGDRIDKSVIDYRIREAKKKKIENMMAVHGYIFCEEIACGKNTNSGEPIDVSHDISVNDCQKLGYAEMAYEVRNMTMRCRTCHQIHDKNGIST